MTDYTKITDFAAKDTLPTGSAGKIIRGSEFETEFDNISTAIATKADASGGTLTSVDINSGTIDGTNIGANVAGTGTFSTLTAGGLSYPSSDGTDGQVITTDGAGNLAFESVDVVNTHTLSFTASGSVSANSFVVLDGVNETVTEVTGTLPTESSTVDLTTTGWGSAGYNFLYEQFHIPGPAGKKVITNAYSHAHVIDMSGTTPNIGSDSGFPVSSTPAYGLHWNPTESRLIVIQGDNIYSGSISGTTITWGSATSLSSLSGTTGETRTCFYDSVSQKSILVWAGYERIFSPTDTYTWENIDAHVLTLDGSGNITVESGASVMVEADLPSFSDSFILNYPSVVPTYIVGHPGQSKAIIGWSEREGSNGSTPDYTHKAKTLTVSGTTITVGSTENTLSGLPTGTNSSISPWSPKSVFWDSSGSNLILTNSTTYAIFSVSGNVVSISTPSTLEIPGTATGPYAYWNTMQYNSGDDEYTLAVYTSGGGYGVAKYTWDGSSFNLQNTRADIISSVGTGSTSVLADFYDATYDKYLVVGTGSSGKVALHYTPGTTTLPPLTGTEYKLCYALESGANTESVKVQFGKSIIGGFTGLTPGASYFLDHTGEPNATKYTATLAGTALTATKMVIS